VIDFASVANIGPVLDLGCGTGLVALALSDLMLGPVTGIDLSPRMLDQARSKELYATLREARLPDGLRDEKGAWRLILAADVLCYFGALDEMFDAVRARLRPGGRFIFSVEELLPDHDGNLPGNGDWALGRLGRYSHAPAYVARTADERGFRCLSLDRETLRYEAGGPVAGLMMVLERPRDDA
jgi:predicted TPR repeat methyltransferase